MHTLLETSIMGCPRWVHRCAAFIMCSNFRGCSSIFAAKQTQASAILCSHDKVEHISSYLRIISVPQFNAAWTSITTSTLTNIFQTNLGLWHRFLCAGCSFCHPTNGIKALTAKTSDTLPVLLFLPYVKVSHIKVILCFDIHVSFSKKNCSLWTRFCAIVKKKF